jgi:hypothetical protein
MSGEPACTLAGFADITEEIAGHGRGVDYSIAQVERLSAFFIMLIGFEWVRPRLAPGTRATFELRHYSIFPQRLAAQRIPDPRATGGGSVRPQNELAKQNHGGMSKRVLLPQYAPQCGPRAGKPRGQAVKRVRPLVVLPISRWRESNWNPTFSRRRRAIKTNSQEVNVRSPPLRTHLPEWHHRLRPHQGIHRRPCQKQKPGCDHDSDVGGEPGQNPMQHGAHASLLSITRQVYHIS